LVFKEDKADRFPKWINRMAWLGAKMPFLLTPTSPQSPTTPNQQSNTPNSPATDSPTKSFTPFSGSGKKLNRTGSIKSVFSKKPDSPGTADREQVLRATQNRFATNSPTTK
jgi:acetylglutamate synthase